MNKPTPQQVTGHLRNPLYQEGWRNAPGCVAFPPPKKSTRGEALLGAASRCWRGATGCVALAFAHSRTHGVSSTGCSVTLPPGCEPLPPLATLRQAFTLIELLVVVSIVGVLIALMVPAITTMRAKGKSTFVLNNLRSIGGATASYVSDNGGCYPAMCYRGFQGPYWTGELTPYMARPVYNRYRTYDGGGPYVSPQFVDPFVKDGNHHSLGDFGCNQELFAMIGDTPNGGGPLLTTPRSIAVVTQPSRLIAVFSTESGSADSPRGSWYANSYIIALSSTVPSWSNRPAFRDGKNIDALFADGHTETISKTRLDQEKKNLLLLEPSQW